MMTAPENLPPGTRARLRRSPPRRPPGIGWALAATLSLGACTDAPAGTGNTGGSGSATGGQSGAGGWATGGQPAATGGALEQTGGFPSGGASEGPASGGGAESSGGTSPATGGNSAGGAAGDGGTSSGGGSGGPTGGSSGAEAGSGGAPSGECTRALLDGLLDDYFAALGAGDPSSLPLAANVKFTENAQVTEMGTTPFWANAGPAKYSQRALDTELCMAAAQAVIPEGTTDRPVAIRIKVEQGELTEVETIVVREGDYSLEDSNPGAIIEIAGDIGWHDEVPEAQRATREELVAWMDKYFRLFPSGVCNVADNCTRLENGGGNYACTAGASCAPGSPGPNDAVFEPRVLLADVERGIAVGFTIFQFMTPGHVDMHMAKISGGEVHAVQAILRNTNGQSGWE